MCLVLGVFALVSSVLISRFEMEEETAQVHSQVDMSVNDQPLLGSIRRERAQGCWPRPGAFHFNFTRKEEEEEEAVGEGGGGGGCSDARCGPNAPNLSGESAMNVTRSNNYPPGQQVSPSTRRRRLVSIFQGARQRRSVNYRSSTRAVLRRHSRRLDRISPVFLPCPAVQ